MVHLLLAIIYLAFISLGLPDSLLGSAWPTMYPVFNVPVSYAGIISMIMAGGTIISSLQSDRLTRRWGAGKVTAFSVGTTALALFGFSISNNFWALALWAIPYGLGAGSVDAALNNFVALHYESKHMSWLHCMWGLGASVGPYIMGQALSTNQGWPMGYRYISIIQVVLTTFIFLSLPLWNKHQAIVNQAGESNPSKQYLSLKQILGVRGVKEALVCFFCYCGLEGTAILWASSYFNLYRGVEAETAATYAGMFFIGITSGRFLSGFITMIMSDKQMIRLGQVIIGFGALIMLLPLPIQVSLVGLVLVGLGCAPIYPCIIHSTPYYFGADKSQAIIGVQMASAYVGSLMMPPLFGFLASHINVGILPIYLLLILALMVFMHEGLVVKVKAIPQG